MLVDNAKKLVTGVLITILPVTVRMMLLSNLGPIIIRGSHTLEPASGSQTLQLRLMLVDQPGAMARGSMGSRFPLGVPRHVTNVITMLL
jgi:hypothetical protein